ncbi:MAG: PAS domain S-box protein [Methylobacter sp.]|nr:PAS domain S-box protein [Methylobacter sp.]
MENDIQATLSQMRKEFITRLPDRLDILKTLLTNLECGRRESIETLHRAAHSLVGSAGVHRLMLISEAARNLEQLVAAIPVDGALDQPVLDALRKALANLEAQTVNPCHNFVPQIPGGRTEVPRIVVVEDDEEQAKWLCSMLEQSGYRVEMFHQLEVFAAASLTSEPPSAVIMDMMFPEGDDAGARLIAKLKEQYLTGFPVIFTSVRKDIAAKLTAYRAGATCYLTKPVDIDALLRVLSDSAALTPAEPFRVLLVDDDAEQRTAHGLILRQAGMIVRELGNPLQVPEMLETFAAEVLVLDMYMPECSGPELAVILRDDERYAQTPIVYLSAETCVSKQLLALNRGGDHFLSKPIEPRHLVATVALHARRCRQAREQAESMHATLYERERQQQALDVHAIVSATDVAGTLTYVNDMFCEISGYSRNELLGQNHRIVKSGEHSADFYADIWSTIIQGNVWRGEVCNRRKNGNLYWVETSIVPFLDNTGRPYQYVSIRTDITHIKQVELRLRLLERAVEASSSSISMVDATQPDMPLIYVNPAFERITGYSREEVIGRNCRFLQETETAQQGLDEIRAVLSEGRAGESLVQNYRKDGTPFWNDLRIAPVHDEQGRLTHFIGISDDVTERREAGDALYKSEERLRRSQLYANIGTWDWNIRTGELICSERICSLFGYPKSRQDNSYKNYFHNIHPDDRQRLVDALNACVYQGAEFNIELRCIWPDGMVRWLQERGDVVRAEDGTPLNMLGVVQDITKRKLVELENMEQQARLLIFKHIIENVADAVITIDPAGIIRSFNPAAEKLFGYSAAEITGCNVNLLMPEPYHSEHSQYLARYNAGQPAGIMGKQLELTGLHKDGTIFPLELSVSAMEIEQSRHFSGILRDISQRKQHEREIIAARDEAEHANKAKSEFLSSMSHELRTPMNAILGFGQLLEIEAGLNEDQADYVDEMLKAGRHLLELINEVLDLAKIESGNINLSLEPLSCTELVAECLALVKPIAQVRGITVKDALVGAYVIRADRTRLKQVLLNLLSNAIKYNRPQGEASVQVSVHNGLVRFAVSDTGYGIPAARQQEVFQPFSRLGAEQSDIEGTGIGLTISRRLMKMMGGAIGMESEEGRGSVFWIELPEVTCAQSIGRHHLASATALDTAAGDKRQHTVLYIEDNPANLRLVFEILSMNPKLQLITAHTPELGLELVSARCPELILLDINLPGMDGYQVLSVLRSMTSSKKTPVIAISANATERDIEQGMAAGFDQYITKPIDVMRFLEIVEQFLFEGG